MSRARFLIGLLALLLVLTVIRITLPEFGLRGPLAGRLESVGFALVIAVVGITILVILRLRDAQLSLWWAGAVFLWLCASEPLLRTLLGISAIETGGYPGPFDRWPELPLMLVSFLVFLSLYEASTGPSRALTVAAVAAGAATFTRPFLIIGGIDRLPGVGDLIKLPGEVLTFLLRFEQVFNVAKGLLLWSSLIGNALLIAVFAVALFAVGRTLHTTTIPERARV
jgi:hypothetical protein